ncbi:MAG: FAD-dependent oxidoreductase [Halieaceae bacterium]|jgi:2,4-dienoyl-CoA reductase-like NADH-dependent reductase (Old Yellow Enzyme family)/NADPH-dependent 2,4-dienoyl-CoA reductase/sulfur reductase-like enzyme|nr:FAD-dependent oxidoreductase [Halieaceae bacterium]
MFEHIFSPIFIGKMKVKNRIGLPPMTVGYGTPDATLTERHRLYYETRARGGAGLIVSEAAAINGNRKYGMVPLGLYEDAQIASWSTLAKSIHHHDAKVGVQLMDPGPESIQMLTGITPVGPSAVAGRSLFRSLPRELTTGEVEAVVDDFAEAVRRARDAGLDCVQIHAAHGYAMVGSFLSPAFNKRTDRYGGSLQNRLQFLLEIITAVRDRVGPDFPIMLRMSGDERCTGGRTVQETQFISRILVQAGVDGLEISGGTIPTTFYAVVPPQGTELALNASYASAIKEVVDVPVICVGRINTPQIAEFVISTGKADMVSMGRALNADPELPNKAAAGRLQDIRPCVGCNEGCINAVMSGLPAGCIINTEAGKESDNLQMPAQQAKRVLVAGGGPAGLEAARMAAVRGHEVTLCESSGKLGGQVNLACVAPFKQELSQVVSYLSREVKKVGVKVELGREVTPALVEELQPEVVIVATGATPSRPAGIPGIDGDNVVTAWEVLAGTSEAAIASDVLIVGGGLVACELADFLADTDDNTGAATTRVTMIEMQPLMATQSVDEIRHLVMQRLVSKGVQMINGATVNEILDDGVIYTNGDGNKETIRGVEYIILAMGSSPHDKLSAALQNTTAEVHVIGDAKKVARILEATSAAAELASKI